MPPEQFGGKVSPASDLYALGATLIYLATGSHPSELPQKELRILFVERVNLSHQTIGLLQCLTEPSLDLRPRSARSCLEAIDTANLTHPVVSIPTKPQGSRVKIKNTPERFEVIIPPRNFNFNLTLVSYFICFFFCALTFVSSGDFFFYRACIFITALLITLSCATIKLTIDRREILRSFSIFGWQFWFDAIIPRTSIIQIELTKLLYTASPYGPVSVCPRINIWAGTLKIELGGDEYLSPSELEWLAAELRNWLHLPISK